MSRSEIYAAIPHREPFLMVDEIVERGEKRIVCRKTFRGDEFFYAGHYPHCPITPGVLLCEAAMQAGAILLSGYLSLTGDEMPVAARMNDVKFKRIVRPGETVEIDVELVKRMARAYCMKAVVRCQSEVAVRFEFTCTTTPRF